MISLKEFINMLEEAMHKKIMKKAAKALEKDAKHYAREEKIAKKQHEPKKAKQEAVEKKEAKSAAKALNLRAKKAHEY